MLSSLVINPTTITVGAATLYGFCTITSLAIRRAKRRFYAWKNRSPPIPAIPQEIQHSIITSIIESEIYNNKSNILQLSLVCKNWHRFVSYHQLWEQNWQYGYYTKSYYDNCSALSPKLRFFWLHCQEQQESDLPKILDPAKRHQYEQYLPWMNHNIFKYPEILFKFLKAVITAPEWIYFLVIRRARSSRGFYRNEYNAKRMVHLQRILFVFTTAIPFMAILTPILKTNIWSQLMNSTSIWSALWQGAPNLPVLTQLRLLAILGAFLPFDLSLFLKEAYATRTIPFLVMALANGGILRFVGAVASAFAINKWHLRLEKELIPLPYWKLAFIVTYPLSSSLYLASMLVWELSLNNTMKPTLQSFRNAKYWLLFGTIVTGLMLALP